MLSAFLASATGVKPWTGTMKLVCSGSCSSHGEKSARVPRDLPDPRIPRRSGWVPLSVKLPHPRLFLQNSS